MKTSLNNTIRIEKYLLGQLNPPDRFLFEAQLLLNPGLRMDFLVQKKVYTLLKMYHRKKLKAELGEVHRQLFSDPEKLRFQQHIFQLFNAEK
jgi:hypothetical protein